MGDYTVPIIAVGVFAAIIFFAWFTNRNRIQSRNRQGEIARGGPGLERIAGIKDKRITPGGVKLLIEPGANHPTEPEIGIIEDALLDCFIKAKALGYTKALALTEHTIAILKSERSPVDQTWSFLVPDLSGQYAGTEFDKGGYIFAAELVSSYGGTFGNAFCVADAHGAVTQKDRDTLYNATMYGAEHIILFHNDLEEFKRTEVHTTGGHPLF